MNLHEAFVFLRDNKYILSTKGIYSFSKTFYEDLKLAKQNQPLPPRLEVATIAHPELPVVLGVDYQRLFIQFIAGCNIPKRIMTYSGLSYEPNKFNKDACKEFEKMMKDQVDLSILTMSTTMYYASATGYKKKISNYILDGDWLTDYEAMKMKIETGDKKQVTDHIKDTLSDGGHSSFRH